MTPAGPPHRPRSPTPEQLGFRQRRSVRWLDPRQLITTGWQAVVSGIFGSFADKREVEAVLGAASLDDRTAAREMWIDYAADVGDGFKATYTVAGLLAAPELELAGPGGDTHETRRGRILVFGGDQVYPTAKETEYEDRFAGPYRAALPWSGKPNPTLLAIPGNHDW
ncbi:MAG: metallophosphoesterase, partial [Actinomycetota bacterium]